LIIKINSPSQNFASLLKDGFKKENLVIIHWQPISTNFPNFPPLSAEACQAGFRVRGKEKWRRIFLIVKK